jgi:hypothetical protein
VKKAELPGPHPKGGERLGVLHVWSTVLGPHGPRTTRWEFVTLTVVRHTQGMSRQRHAARWLRFPAPFGAVLPQVIIEPQSCAFGVWLRFSSFSPSVEFCCSATEIGGGKWTTPPGGTTQAFDIFIYVCKTPPTATAGQSHTTGAVVLADAVGAISPPAVRTAFPNPNCQKGEATLAHHKHALHPPDSCGFFLGWQK